MTHPALPQDIWACPACEEGWQQYVIATDQNVCSKCGYTGGDPEKWRKLLSAVRNQPASTSLPSEKRG